MRQSPPLRILAEDIDATTRARFITDVRPEGNCIVWIGRRNRRNYGIISYKGRTTRAHRIAYALTHGELPAGVFVCHACDNPPCIHPDHLWVGTAADNNADCDRKGRHHRPRSHWDDLPEDIKRVLSGHDAD